MKLNIIKYLLIFVAVLSAEPGYLKYNQAFGIKASNLAGYGVFYGYKPSADIKLQATGMYYLFDSELGDARHKITNYTIGLEIQKDIMQKSDQRVYLMAGCYYYRDDDQEIDLTPLRVKNNSYNYGLGIGYEYFFHRVTLGAELGYKLYTDRIIKTENSIEMPEFEREAKLGAGINLGFIF